VSAPWITEHRAPREGEVAAYAGQFKGIRGLWRSRGAAKRIAEAAGGISTHLAAMKDSVSALAATLEAHRNTPEAGR
jgi:hypothetical protein